MVSLRSDEYAERSAPLCLHCRALIECAIKFKSDEKVTEPIAFELETILRGSKSCFICYRLVWYCTRRLPLHQTCARHDRDPSAHPLLVATIEEIFGKKLYCWVCFDKDQIFQLRIRDSYNVDGYDFIDFEIVREDALYSTRTPFHSGTNTGFLPKLALEEPQIAQIRQWLDQCAHHETCSRQHRVLSLAGKMNKGRDFTPLWPVEHFRPTRLVQVGKDGDDTRLVLTSSDGFYPYATLSHCWGTKRFETLRSDNYLEFLRGIDSSHLTKTFRETIALCRILEVEYLWIDSLCIVQGSLQDTVIEIGLMDQIYANSICNIAATASRNGDEGLFRPINDLATGLLSIDKLHIRNDVRFFLEVLKKSPLFERGWIVQEMALSPRTIHFTDTSISWSCREMCSIGGLVGPAQLFSGDKLNLEVLNEVDEVDRAWLRLSQDFAPTSVTHAEDRAFALVPLATHFARRYATLECSTEYVAGCWTHNIHLFLSWHRLRKPKSSRNDCAPLWSWLSAPGFVDFDFRWIDRRDFKLYNTLKVIDKDIILRVPSAAAGPLHHGYLLLESAWAKAHSSPTALPSTNILPREPNLTIWDENARWTKCVSAVEIWDEAWWEEEARDVVPFVLLLLAEYQDLISAGVPGWSVRGLICKLADPTMHEIRTAEGAPIVERCGTFLYEGRIDKDPLPPFHAAGKFWLV